MTTFILAILLAAGPCHANTATTYSSGTVVSLMDDTGGETGHVPTDPLPPPHPNSPIPIP